MFRHTPLTLPYIVIVQLILAGLPHCAAAVPVRFAASDGRTGFGVERGPFDYNVTTTESVSGDGITASYVMHPVSIDEDLFHSSGVGKATELGLSLLGDEFDDRYPASATLGGEIFTGYWGCGFCREVWKASLSAVMDVHLPEGFSARIAISSFVTNGPTGNTLLFFPGETWSLAGPGDFHLSFINGPEEVRFSHTYQGVFRFSLELYGLQAGDAWIEFDPGMNLLAPVPGDTDGDRVVGIDDLNNVRNNFGTIGEEILGDTDGNAIVDVVDLNNVRNNFGTSSIVPAVPEPSSIALLGIAVAGAFAFRGYRS